MATADPDARRESVSFFDSFLQEKNIKYMLAMGLVILLASSLMLVTSHWHEEGYTPLLKYLTLLAYAGAVFGASQWSYFHAGLRKTGTVLMSLSVLLVPLGFVALRWIHPPGAPLLSQGASLALVAVNLALSVTVARRVFRHFLQGAQPTFTASFVLLSLAGAITPSASWGDSPLVVALAVLTLWALFAVGTIKVNRHVFWLVEQRRWPRVCGFFPILLLGSQFLLLVGLNFARLLAFEWWGLGCVLVAIPILLTADTVARVFQDRTGNLVRPLPWSIGLPLFIGITLCLAGVAISASGLRPPHVVPLALVPTALLAAGMMGVVARRTGHAVLVWAMLALVTLGYNFSYVFFQTTARYLIQTGATAVHEQRLPLAFYGLTYLPLLLGLIAGSRFARRRGSLLFAGPLQSFCIALSTLLIGLSCTHGKAMLPVGLTLTALLGLEMVAFREPRLVLRAIAAWVIAGLGTATFLLQVLHIALPPDAVLLFPTLSAAALLMPGCLVDRRCRQHFEKEAAGQIQLDLCQIVSAVYAVILAVVWSGWYAWQIGMPQAWPAAILIGGLLAIQALRWADAWLGSIAYLFGVVAATSAILGSAVLSEHLLSIAAGTLLVQWVAGHYSLRRPDWRTSQAFGPVLRYASQAGLAGVLLFECLPMLVVKTFRPEFSYGAWELAWPLRLLVIAWSFDAARRYRAPQIALLGYVTLLALAGTAFTALLGVEYRAWLPAVGAVVALVGFAAVEMWRWLVSHHIEDELAPHRLLQLRAVAEPIDVVNLVLQLILAFSTLLVFDGAFRVAGVLALAGLVMRARRPSPLLGLAGCLALANWQALALVATFAAPGLCTAFELTASQALAACLPLALAAVVSLAFWQIRRLPISRAEMDVRLGQQVLLKAAVWMGLIVSLQFASLSLFHAAAALLTFAILIACQLRAACLSQQVHRVWIAECFAALAVGYFAWFHVITFGRGLSMFVLLGVSLVFWAFSRLAARHEASRILSEPFEQTAMAMPLVVVGLGLFRHCYRDPQWLGINSLALLLAAGFYFWRAVEEKKSHWWLVSFSILNVACLLLWRELEFSDPQFYMVPLGMSVLALVQILKREIPAEHHDPLRYLGALMILVSPTFHIVGGSWAHLVSLMIAAVLVSLVAIGTQVRALLYTGTAFLAADLVAMVVRGSLDHPNVLWIAGLGLGAAVLGLAAACENNREKLQQRLRMLTATLAQWE